MRFVFLENLPLNRAITESSKRSMWHYIYGVVSLQLCYHHTCLLSRSDLGDVGARNILSFWPVMFEAITNWYVTIFSIWHQSLPFIRSETNE